MFYSVVANRRQPNLYTWYINNIYRGGEGWRRGYSVFGTGIPPCGYSLVVDFPVGSHFFPYSAAFLLFLTVAVVVVAVIVVVVLLVMVVLLLSLIHI